MKNNYLKFSVFIFLLVILFIFLIYSVFGFDISVVNDEYIKSERTLSDRFDISLKINGLDVLYDKISDVYFLSVPDKYENKFYVLNIDLPSGYKYKIVNRKSNIIVVDYDKEYSLIVYNKRNYDEIKIKLTNLPLMEIKTNFSITDSDTNAIFKYINSSNFDQVITYNSKIHIRGAATRKFDKKSYKISIYDESYNKEKNINISNFYYGSAFILDAVYRDDSKIRNVLATELWNEFSSDFGYISIYSEFVELFINEQYVGLYVFTEPVNRKTLCMSKSSGKDTSVIVKSNQREMLDPNSDFKNITSEQYLDYELKYPNDQNLFDESWYAVMTKLLDYYSLTNKTYESINNLFNINNYVDIILFNSFINNEDNKMNKNNYFYMSNLRDKLHIQPWDMEYSFGLRASSRGEIVDKVLDDYDKIKFEIYHENSNEINRLLINRYWELRESMLNKENLDKLLDNYKNDLNKGVAKRDSSIWRNYNIESEIEDIRIWLYNRIEVYDEYIRGLEYE